MIPLTVCLQADWSLCAIGTIYYVDYTENAVVLRAYYGMGQHGSLAEISEEYANECLDEAGWRGPTPLPSKP